MDILAGEASEEAKTSSIRRTVFNTTSMALFNQKGEYITDVKTQIIHQKGYQILWNYLKSKNSWEEQSMKEINWHAMEIALRTYKLSYRTRMMQLMHDWQYTGDRKILMKDGDGTCPMKCGYIEVKMHYIWCKSDSITSKKLEQLHLFKLQAEAVNTYPGITSAIIKILACGYTTTWIQAIDKKSPLD